MIHLANILIATDDAAFGDDLVGKLRRHRYQVQVVGSQDEAVAAAGQERPDIVLLGTSIKGGDPMTLTRTLKASPTTADIPVCLLSAEASAELQNRALAAGMVDMLTPPLSETKLIARLRPLVRLSSMQTELQQRGQVAQKFGISIDTRTHRRKDEGQERILLIGGPAEELARHLPHAQISAVEDPYQAEDELENHNYDAAIAIPNGDPARYLDLCVQIRNNPRLFNLPVIMIAKADEIGEDAAYKHGVSGYFKHPADPFELNNATLFMVRRQKQRWSIREALGEAETPLIKDPATDVFSRPFFDAYLSQRVAYALNHGRPLSIGFFRVPDVENIRQRFGEEQANHLRLQVSQWISGLLRVEDMTARYEDNEFCVLLPDSPESEASLVINRIAGVLAYTDFAVRDVYEPVKVWVRAGYAELTDEDTTESLIARARQAMVA
jgi:two-component system cell cycle response regulator